MYVFPVHLQYVVFRVPFRYLVDSETYVGSQSLRPIPLTNLGHPSTLQLVFHFAKYEEAKRMVAVMDIAVLLERLRDAFTADKSSLVGRSGSLPFHVMNDIDMAFRVCCALNDLDTRVNVNVHPAESTYIECSLVIKPPETMKCRHPTVRQHV